jgi:hypothetical protein
VAAVDLVGNEAESAVAETLRGVAQSLEQDPHVGEAVLTLSVAGDPPLRPTEHGAQPVARRA